jgi:hypothetical protein
VHGNAGLIQGTAHLNFSSFGIKENFVQHDGKWVRLPSGFDPNNLPAEKDDVWGSFQTYDEYKENFETVGNLITGLKDIAQIGKAIGTHLSGINPYIGKPTKSLTSSLKKFEKLIAEYKQKLADYIKDPDKFDNLGKLKNVTKELKDKIINGRIKELTRQIEKQTGELEKVKEAITKAKKK